jgi:mono/diheme cytochrome c family protein
MNHKTLFIPLALVLLACTDKKDDTAARAPRPPEELFFKEGCIGCHGPGSMFAARLVTTRARPPEEIARWILHPTQMNPGSMMPAYAGRISQEEALALARWIKSGNPVPPASE